MNNTFTFFTIATTLFLSACAVGPDFERPTADLPQAYENAGALEMRPPEREDITKWWKRFNDPLLDSLIERALDNNFDIQSARASIAAARASLGVSQSGLFPTLDASSGFNQSGSGTTASAATYNAGLSAQWEVDVFGQTRRGIESSEADYIAAKADKCAVQISVASEVALAYYLYRASQEGLRITQENLETQKQTYEIMQRQVEAGIKAPLDAVRSLSQMLTTSSQIPTLETARTQSRYALELLLGLPVGGLREELEGYKEMPDVLQIIPYSVPAELVARRPDIIAAEYRIKSASAKIGQAKADFFPKFFISGNISYSAPTSANLFEKQYGTWSVGPTVQWNLFNGGKTFYNMRLQEAITREAGISWEQLVIGAIKEVEDNMIASANEAVRVKTLSEVVESNKTAYEMSQLSEKVGILDTMDLLDVQRNLLSSQQSLIDSRRLVLANLISLYKALGGGWSDNDMDDPEYENDTFLLF